MEAPLDSQGSRFLTTLAPPIARKASIAADHLLEQAYHARRDAGRIGGGDDRFVDGAVYVYTYASAGRRHVEAMKRLARAGAGLSTYISRYIRAAYAARRR